MKICECLLDCENGFALEGATVGEHIGAANIEHLWDERKDNFIDTIVIHYTSAVNVCPQDPYSLAHILKIFCDYGVSAHYLILRNGEILRLVPEEAKAWHAGLSIMPAPDDRMGVNEFSIGIELAATADSGFTDEQYAALNELCADIEKRHGRKFNYVGHDQIAGERAVALGLREAAKVDPGALFEWERIIR